MAGADPFDGDEVGEIGEGLGFESGNMILGTFADGFEREVGEEGGLADEGIAAGVGEEFDAATKIAENGGEEEGAERPIGFGGGGSGPRDVEAGDDPEGAGLLGQVLRGEKELALGEEVIDIGAGEEASMGRIAADEAFHPANGFSDRAMSVHHGVAKSVEASLSSGKGEGSTEELVSK